MFSGVLVETIKSSIFGEKEIFVTNQEFFPSTLRGSQILCEWNTLGFYHSQFGVEVRCGFPFMGRWSSWHRQPVELLSWVVSPAEVERQSIFSHLVDTWILSSHWLNKSFGSCKLFASCGCCLSFLVSKFLDPIFGGNEKSLYVEVRAVFVMIFMVSQLAFGLQLSDPPAVEVSKYSNGRILSKKSKTQTQVPFRNTWIFIYPFYPL